MRLKRRPIITAQDQKALAVTTTVAAPVLGLNSIDNLVSMPPNSAITLNNFVVRPFGCEVRKGSRKYATGITGNTESLLTYNANSESGSKMFACANNAIYDITASGAIGAAVVTAMNSNKWEHVNFSTAGGRWMIAVNGVDAPRLYNGTTWSAFSEVATPANPGEVFGVDPAKWTNVTHFKLRVWAVEKDSSKAWYLPINSVGGTATVFDFGSYTRKGGHLVAITSWSIDAGKGLDDYLVAVTSEGEVLVYEGTDPSSSATFKLVGIWEVAKPIGKRCFMKYAGEVLYLSEDGVTVLQKYLNSDGIDVNTALSVPIRQILTEQVAENKALFGWQLIHLPKESVVILNVPRAAGSTQYVFNTITRAWSQFTGWDVKCFAVFKGELYYGSANTVLRGFDGYTDAADTSGLNGAMYQATAQQAFNYFEKPGQKKHFKMVRITATSTVSPAVAIGVNADFDFGIQPTSMSQAAIGSSIWATSVWNAATWSRESGTIKKWSTISAIGYAASLTLVINVSGKITWTATDWLLEPGGII